ncbi:hypothetical protein DPMN_075589 [Dreissena polymorpha]|uniref:Uncharacterized protein n=1 Tax=Dreissena polymorpha TaxID=45954 RepID=A0A9D3YH38_DREPO|nr:hypothetical protein DPMN_075589 [Dreissena polymorpha]
MEFCLFISGQDDATRVSTEKVRNEKDSLKYTQRVLINFTIAWSHNVVTDESSLNECIKQIPECHLN